MWALRGSAVALVVCGALPLGTLAKAPTPPPAVPPEAVKAVKGVLPKGWDASTKGVTLTVRREKKVGLWDVLDPGLDGEPPIPTETKTYEITLRFRPRLTAEKYERLVKENESTGAKLEEMRDRLRAAKITHKFDDWVPSTPEQKKLVEEYRAAQKTMPFHHLPDCYTETHSIDIADSVQFPMDFAYADEAKECNRVKAAVHALFKPYSR